MKIVHSINVTYRNESNYSYETVQDHRVASRISYILDVLASKFPTFTKLTTNLPLGMDKVTSAEVRNKTGFLMGEFTIGKISAARCAVIQRAAHSEPPALAGGARSSRLVIDDGRTTGRIESPRSLQRGSAALGSPRAFALANQERGTRAFWPIRTVPIPHNLMVGYMPNSHTVLHLESARIARKSDEALGVRVIVARIAPLTLNAQIFRQKNERVTAKSHRRGLHTARQFRTLHVEATGRLVCSCSLTTCIIASTRKEISWRAVLPPGNVPEHACKLLKAVRDKLRTQFLQLVEATVAERLACLTPRPGQPASLHVEIVPDDAVDRRAFSGISCLRRPFIGSQYLDVKSRPNIFNQATLGSIRSFFTLFERPRCCSGLTTRLPPSSIPSVVTLVFSPLGIVPDDAADRRVFSGISRFLRSCPPAPHRTPLAASGKLEGTVNGLYAMSCKEVRKSTALTDRLAHGGGITDSLQRKMCPYSYGVRVIWAVERHSYYAVVRRQQCSPIGLARPEPRPQPYRTSLGRIGSPGEGSSGPAKIHCSTHGMVARGMATNPRGSPANTRREHARQGGCCHSRKRWPYEILTGDFIPGGIAFGCLHAGILLDDATGRWVFSGISRFSRPCIPAEPHVHTASPSSALQTSMSRATPTSWQLRKFNIKENLPQRNARLRLANDHKGDDISSSQEILTSDNALGNALCSVIPNEHDTKPYLPDLGKNLHKSEMAIAATLRGVATPATLIAATTSINPYKRKKGNYNHAPVIPVPAESSIGGDLENSRWSARCGAAIECVSLQRGPWQCGDNEIKTRARKATLASGIPTMPDPVVHTRWKERALCPTGFCAWLEARYWLGCLLASTKLNTISAYTRQKAKSKYRNRIWLERATQKQSSYTHKTPYDRPESIYCPVGLHNIPTIPSGGCSGLVVRLPAYYQDDPSSITGVLTLGFSSEGIVPHDAAGRRVYSEASHFSRPCILAPIHTHFVSLLDVKSRPNLSSFHSYITGAMVVKRLACLPPTKAIRVQSIGRVTPDFRMWES
ncbi:hypothetical protein PR048_018930 [Dryococelus australis]|uniref:Uncharacterized protein n=1 Tax=Dryococelus australis TaxID=614101 RepID=A0ABQ9H220_9NEOP|nr:hypothetical protein PR048_018930 [Dryococelus australis]